MSVTTASDILDIEPSEEDFEVDDVGDGKSIN